MEISVIIAVSYLLLNLVLFIFNSRLEKRIKQHSQQCLDSSKNINKVLENIKAEFSKNEGPEIHIVRIPVEHFVGGEYEDPIEKISQMDYDDFMEYIEKSSFEDIQQAREIFIHRGLTEKVAIIDGYLKSKGKA